MKFGCNHCDFYCDRWKDFSHHLKVNHEFLPNFNVSCKRINRYGTLCDSSFKSVHSFSNHQLRFHTHGKDCVDDEEIVDAENNLCPSADIVTDIDNIPR